MITQAFDFLKSDTGKRIVGWVLSSGVGLVVFGFWVYSLTMRIDKVEDKMNTVENKLETVNTELKTYYKNDRDTLMKTLTITNTLLQKIENRTNNGTRNK